jgi:hypothetical protein
VVAAWVALVWDDGADIWIFWGRRYYFWTTGDWLRRGPRQGYEASTGEAWMRWEWLMRKRKKYKKRYKLDDGPQRVCFSAEDEFASMTLDAELEGAVTYA